MDKFKSNVKSCCEATKYRLEDAWEWYKSRSKAFLLLFSMILGLMALLLIGGGGFLIATLSTSTGDVVGSAAIGVGGVILIVTLVGIVGYVQRSVGIARFEVFLCVLLFITELVMISIVNSYISHLRTISNPDSSTTSAEFSGGNLRMTNDFTLSLYTYCCTSCDEVNCKQDLPETPYCNSVASASGSITDDQISILNGRCLLVPLCEDFPDNSVERCFTKSNDEGFIPSFEIPQSFCEFLESSRWGEQNKPIVGPAGGTVETGVSCGGRDPKVFQLSIYDWARENYAWIATLFAFTMILQIGVGSASLAFSIHMTSEPRAAPKKKDKIRPFER